MTPVLLDIDPHSGAVETFDYDDGEETIVIRRQCDVAPIIDRNKALANHGVWDDRSHGVDGPDLRLAASIPIDVAYLWLQRYGVRAWLKEDWPKVRRLLNDGEWQYLRVREFVI
jgi:hypothetical protein